MRFGNERAVRQSWVLLAGAAGRNLLSLSCQWSWTLLHQKKLGALLCNCFPISHFRQESDGVKWWLQGKWRHLGIYQWKEVFSDNNHRLCKYQTLQDLLCVERFSSVHWRAFTKKDGIINPVLQVGFMVCKVLWSPPAYSQPVGKQPHNSPLQTNALLFAFKKMPGCWIYQVLNLKETCKIFCMFILNVAVVLFCGKVKNVKYARRWFFSCLFQTECGAYVLICCLVHG